MNKQKVIITSLLTFFTFVGFAQVKTTDKENVDAEHGMINMGSNKSEVPNKIRTGTAWYPEAKFGLFIHWGLSSVNNLDISWPMIPGRGLAGKDLSDDEIKDIVAKKDYNRYTDRPLLVPNTYWAAAEKFNPQDYDPDKWIKAAKEAGFTYAVLTARHHEGFALWPSASGNFSTKNYMGGKDLIKPFVEACRKYGLKVGLYFSPPDWHFEKDFMNFLYYKAAKNPKLPKLDADLNPRTTTPTKEQWQQHYKEYAEHVRTQITELLTNYGKIDLFWFDGAPPIPNAKEVVTKEYLLKLQPEMIYNPRLFGKGDFVTFERDAPKQNPPGWAEFCNTWTNSWANSTTLPFRAPAFVLGQLALCNSWNVNYLLGVGPNAQGEMSPDVYKNMDIVAKWMKVNGEAIRNTNELDSTETANVPANAKGNVRYLFSIPKFKNKGSYPEDQLPAADETLTIKIARKPTKVSLLGSKNKLNYTYANNELQIQFPAAMHSTLVDVVKVEM